MKILCLHSRGSNAEIFQLQTATLRSLLDDFTFEFLQGGLPHQRGMSYLHTMDYADSQRYQWFNLLVPQEVMQAELELLEFAKERGPFDGVLAFSQGSQFAAQTLIRYSKLNPFATAGEKPFRFAVFFNGVTPGDAVELPEEVDTLPFDQISDLMKLVLSLNAPEVKEQPNLKVARLPDGREALVNDGYGYARYEWQKEGPLIDIPTLHVRCPKDTYDSDGLFYLCEPSLRKECLHGHGHDFPRGLKEISETARLIRAIAELAT